MKTIDIVYGGNFGDEGKGQACAWLALRKREQGLSYHFAVRVGGSNAEHRFVDPHDEKHTARVLPVAAWIDPNIKIVLGAGHMIKLESFFHEMNELTTLQGDQGGRISIDPMAGVIEPGHVESGRETSWRGSTHQGNGQAVAHKVLRDGKFKTAKEYPELKDFIYWGGTWKLMRNWMAAGKPGLLEGSQGALLSLNHGYYPFCTSKDVTPAALLAEAGIATKYIRDIYGVYRTVPMRVPGNSGPSGGEELTWEQLEKAMGRDLPESVKRQTDSGDRERVFLWSWDEFIKSVVLCGPTRMVLTFADWWPTELMSINTEELIRNMEELASCPVIMVRNGPNWNDYKIFPSAGKYGGMF